MGKSFRTRGSVEKDRGGRDKVGIQVVAQELNLARPLGEITHGLCNHVPLFIIFVIHASEILAFQCLVRMVVGWIDCGIGSNSNVRWGCQY